jgi:hypothetical protein
VLFLPLSVSCAWNLIFHIRVVVGL